MISAWAQRGWQGDTASLKDLARHAGSLATKNVTLAADRDFHLNEVIQIPDHVGPFQLPLLARQTVFQFLAQQQRQERAKYMPANRFVALVQNRPCIQQRFHRAEDIFDHPQLFVLQRHLTRREIHVRRQYPLAVVARFLLDLVLVNSELFASPAQVFAIPFVAHQRLVALAQRVAQRGHHGFAIVAVLLGLILVHAHHIAPRTLDPDFFHLQRRGIVAVVAFGMHFRIAASARHHRLGFRRTPHAHAQDVLPLPFFHFRQGRGADHPPVGNDANRSDSEPLLQPFDDGNQALHIRRVAGPQFGAERIAVLVQHHAHYHLLQVGTMIFGVSTLADSLASCALEVDRRGIEKHDVQIGEQITAPRKQRLLNEVLVGAGSERRSAVLLVFRKHLSQPGHGPVELVQAQIADAFDGVVVLPLLGGTVTAGREEAMQHGEEDGPLDGEFKASAFEQGGEDFADRAGLPESLEDQGRPDPGAARGDAVAACMGAEDGEFFGESSQRLDQGVELAAGQQLIKAAKTKQDALLDLAVDPLVIHDEQISSGTVGLRANEQIGAPVSLSWITRRRLTSTVFSYLQIRRDTRISRWQASPCLESTSCGQLASPTVEDESRFLNERRADVPLAAGRLTQP